MRAWSAEHKIAPGSWRHSCRRGGGEGLEAGCEGFKADWESDWSSGLGGNVRPGQKHRHTDEAQAVRRDVRPGACCTRPSPQILDVGSRTAGVEPGIRSDSD